MDNDTKTELAHIVLAAAQREHTTFRVTLSEGFSHKAEHHLQRLLGIREIVRDLYEADMIDGQHYDLISEVCSVFKRW